MTLPKDGSFRKSTVSKEGKRNERKGEILKGGRTAPSSGGSLIIRSFFRPAPGPDQKLPPYDAPRFRKLFWQGREVNGLKGEEKAELREIGAKSGPS